MHYLSAELSIIIKNTNAFTSDISLTNKQNDLSDR